MPGTTRFPALALLSGAVLASGCLSERPLGPDRPKSLLPGATAPNLKVAFIGDQDNGANAVAVLQLIRNEGAHMVLHQGDFDYSDDPAGWDAMITSVLGASFPYFASVGNHDEVRWSGPDGYQAKLQQRLARVPEATCTGDLGVKSTCTYRGLYFILSGVGTLGSNHEAYLRQQLAADESIWRLCTWHKNQQAMQVGGKGNEVGWGAYEACRELGAIIATAHEHSYSRTKTLVSTQLQTVDPLWPFRDSLRVAPGATFVFVSGLGGNSIREQLRCLPTTYPYGCNGEWASIYSWNQSARYGALFIEFNVDNDPTKARGYFKNINGLIVDRFVITSQTTVADPSPPAVDPPVVVDAGADGAAEGESVSLTATFQDPDGDGPYAATINWGDGSPPEPGAVAQADGGGTVTGTHVYQDNGTFSATVTVHDGDGGAGQNAATVNVANLPPTVADAGGPYAGLEGVPITFSGSAAGDAGAADVLTYQWDFDYGAGQAFDVDGTGQVTAHAFPQEGSRTVALRVADDDGGVSDPVTAQVTVTDADPVAGFTFTPAAPSAGQAVAFTDQSVSADGVTWEWDFDGTGGPPDATVQHPTHTFTVAGDFTVVLTVREPDGDAASFSRELKVIDQPPVRLYFSLAGSATLSGASVANEDIVAFDGSTFALYFDGSDVGLSAFALDAFAIVSPTEILMSFTGSGTVPGVAGTVQDEDIVRFTATSLGATTTGAFTLYFDGSDVGLSSSSDEDVDAIELLPDGRLLVSTVGSVGVTGVSGQDEDLLAFTPASLGSVTSGAWAMYFDGSDVGLASTSDEDVDATAVDATGRIYLSTIGNFSVPGRSGADEDVFVFIPTSLGPATAGSYSAFLHFDGSAFGLGARDLAAIDLP
jgi:hypothetical protein